MAADLPVRKRDRARIAAWSSAAIIAGSLLLAGVMYRPEPDVEVLFSVGEFKLRLGLFDEAKADLERVVTREPKHGHAWLLLGHLAERSGDAAAALEHYLAARPTVDAAGDPAFLSEYLVATGLLRLRTGDLDGAREDAEALLALDVRPAAGFLIRAFSRLGVGSDRGYRQDLARAFEKDSSDPVFRLGGDFLGEAIPWASAFLITDPAGRSP